MQKKTSGHRALDLIDYDYMYGFNNTYKVIN